MAIYRFAATLESGEKRLNEVLSAAKNEGRAVTGAEAFMLYDTFGFPLEITQELASLHDIQVRWPVAWSMGSVGQCFRMGV